MGKPTKIWRESYMNVKEGEKDKKRGKVNGGFEPRIGTQGSRKGGKGEGGSRGKHSGRWGQYEGVRRHDC